MLLGVAKNTMKAWTETKKIKPEDFERIQESVDSMIVPHDVGRIPGKIKTGFSGFTADQWKNWTIHYSLIALKDILPQQDYLCWQKFVIACRLICSRYVTVQDLDLAQAKLKEFNIKFAALYGNDFCNPNMHLNMHIKDCVMDHGPVYSFWLFSFERYNGILGATVTNNRLISVQLMRKFLQSSFLQGVTWPLDFTKYETILQCDSKKKEKGTLKSVDLCTEAITNALAETKAIDENDFTAADYQIPLGKVQEAILCDDDITDVKEMLSKLYKERVVTVLSIVEHHRRIIQGKYTIYAGETNGSTISAVWYGRDGDIITEGEARVGNVNNLLTVDCVVHQGFKKKKLTHHIAHISWYKKHPNKDFYGEPVTLWEPNVEACSCATYMPLQRIKSLCVVTRRGVKIFNTVENVLLTSPINY